MYIFAHYESVNFIQTKFIRRNKASRITGSVFPIIGTKSPRAVIIIPQFSTFFLPIRSCQIPTGTDSRKKQIKATKGIN